MQGPLRIGAIVAGLSVWLLVSVLTLFWTRHNVDWFAPVDQATRAVDGGDVSEINLYRSSYTPFTLLPDRKMVLKVQSLSGEKQTYVIHAPGPGHLPEGFSGKIRRCESAFIATPFFGFALSNSPCVVPSNSRDAQRDSQFHTQFVEFTDDSGQRLRVKW